MVQQQVLRFLELPDSVLIYDIRNSRWHTVAAMARGRRQPSLAFSEGGVYAVGGESLTNGPSTTLDTVEVFSENSCSWRAVSPMQTMRWGHATAALDVFVYTSGGVAGGVPKVGRYDPEDGSWKFVTPMSEARHWHGMAALKGSLYAIGGHRAKSSGERYEPRRDKWYSEGRLTMREGRERFGLTALDDCLYAVGGAGYKASAERFDPREGHWASIPDMSHGKFYTVSASIGGRVAAIGHSQGRLMMELFDLIANRWEDAVMMDQVQYGFAVTWAPWSPDSLINNANT